MNIAPAPARDKLTILALDTALGACSVAVCRGGETLASAFELRQRGHAEALMPMIEDVCAKAGLALDAIDLFATTVGPGTFTGVRIGLSAARGLALSLDKPLKGYSTLEVIGWGAVACAGNAALSRLAVIHDARREEVYAQLFQVTGASLSAVSQPQLLGLHELDGFIPATPTWLAGSGAGLARDQLSDSARGIILENAPSDPDALVIGAMAARDFSDIPAAAQSLHYLDQTSLMPLAMPLYLRAPDAKLPGGVTL